MHTFQYLLLLLLKINLKIGLRAEVKSADVQSISLGS